MKKFSSNERCLRKFQTTTGETIEVFSSYGDYRVSLQIGSSWTVYTDIVTVYIDNNHLCFDYARAGTVRYDKSQHMKIELKEGS